MIDAAFFIGLVNTFGYLGVFIASFIGSASVFLPLPSFLFAVAGGALLNPFLVGVVAGLGSALGELVSYAIGYGLHMGHKKLRKNRSDTEKKWAGTIKKWFHKKYGPVIIFIFAATPLPDDIIGLFCGAIKYDLKKFFIPLLLGKIILGLFLAYVGLFGLFTLSLF